MRKEDLVAFAKRDWSRIADAKADYWADRKRRMTATEALRLGDVLRREVLTFRSAWQTDEERLADLAAHIRVTEMLRRVQPRRGR